MVGCENTTGVPDPPPVFPAPKPSLPILFPEDLGWPLRLRYTRAHPLFNFSVWTLSPDFHPLLLRDV